MASRKEQKERLRAERLEREQADRSREQRRRLVQYGSGAAFLALCVIVVLVLLSQSGGGSGGDTNVEDQALVTNQLKGIPQHGTVLGDPSAKVHVVEFGDLQCPVCQAFSFQVAPGLISGPVKDGTADYEFRNFTIIGPQSPTAAEAALAAAEQGRYWNFVELFYRNQGEENSGYVTDSFLESIAKGAGVPDIPKWNTDRNSPKLAAEVKKTTREAQALGFSGTPSILVEGPGGRKPLPNVPTLSQLESTIKSVE
jgi:protein-disulfide isomerase